MNTERESKFQKISTRINADQAVIPTLDKNQNFPMTVAHFPDHGRPCFVGSAIRSNPVFFELARNLTQDESKKANDRFRTEVEKILNGEGIIKGGGILSSKDNKPDVFRVTIGESLDPKGLRLYYTRGKFNGDPAVYLLAIAKSKDGTKVEKILENAGYEGTKNWERRKVH